MYLLLPIWMVRHAFPTKLIVALIGFGALGSTGLMNGEVDGFDFFKVWGGIVFVFYLLLVSLATLRH